MNKLKILISGSAGFILGNFVRKGFYDDMPYLFSSIDKVGRKINSVYYNKNHSFHIADITDQHIIDTIFQFEKPDVVVHGAASTHVDDSLSNPNEFINSNVLGTQVIINACVKNNARLIYISTDEVYGQLQENDVPWTEESPLNPRNPYSASKAAGELLVKAAGYSHGLKYNITRSSNNYGPRQYPDKLIPKVIKCILNNEKIPIYGQGLQLRDWTHVSDNCSAIYKIIEKGEQNETYNISSNQEFSNIEVVQRICNALGKGYDLISFIEDPRKGHDFRYAINTDKIKKLGWNYNYSFKDGIVDTVKWYQSNQYFLK